MKYPVKKLVRPKELAGIPNGKLPLRLLWPLRGGGKLFRPAAKRYNEMFVAAKKDGIALVPVARGYRSYDEQLRLFVDRYSDKPTGRVPKVTRKFQGKTWYLKKGMAPCATPGESPHGDGLAQDIDVRDPKVFNWLCKNAPTFGFYLQGTPTLPNGSANPEYEAWHWQWCEGVAR